LATAYRLLDAHAPRLAKALDAVTRRIALHEAGSVNSFATTSAHGMAFLATDRDDDEIFFLEDLAHQGGHILFGAMTFHHRNFLLVNRDTPLRAFTKRSAEARTIYETFHGVFTEALMSYVLDLCIEADLSPSQRHETSGRLALTLVRAHHDVTALDHSGIFTAEGAKVLELCRRVLVEIRRRRRAQLSGLDLTNQPYSFSYRSFLALNPVPPKVLG
jgi:hypothetical protein